MTVVTRLLSSRIRIWLNSTTSILLFPMATFCWSLLFTIQFRSVQFSHSAECWKIDTFQLWCWRRLLRVPWTGRRSNQSILKKINREYSLEGQMLKLKLQHFGHLMQRANPMEKTLMLEKSEAGGEGGGRRWDAWMASPTQWTWIWENSRDSEGQGNLACCSPPGHRGLETT